MVLLAADGASNTTIADRAGVSRPVVLDWGGRHEGKGSRDEMATRITD